MCIPPFCFFVLFTVRDASFADFLCRDVPEAEESDAPNKCPHETSKTRDLSKYPNPFALQDEFFIADTNKNGFNSIREIADFLSKHGGDLETMDDFAEDLMHVDVNKDDILSVQEYAELTLPKQMHCLSETKRAASLKKKYVPSPFASLRFLRSTDASFGVFSAGMCKSLRSQMTPISALTKQRNFTLSTSKHNLNG